MRGDGRLLPVLPLGRNGGLVHPFRCSLRWRRDARRHTLAIVPLSFCLPGRLVDFTAPLLELLKRNPRPLGGTSHESHELVAFVVQWCLGLRASPSPPADRKSEGTRNTDLGEPQQSVEADRLANGSGDGDEGIPPLSPLELDSQALRP